MQFEKVYAKFTDYTASFVGSISVRYFNDWYVFVLIGITLIGMFLPSFNDQNNSVFTFFAYTTLNLRIDPVSKKFLPKWKTGILEEIFAKNEVFVEDLAKK